MVLREDKTQRKQRKQRKKKKKKKKKKKMESQHARCSSISSSSSSSSCVQHVCVCTCVHTCVRYLPYWYLYLLPSNFPFTPQLFFLFLRCPWSFVVCAHLCALRNHSTRDIYKYKQSQS